MVHFCLELEADLFFEATNSLEGARDLSYIEIGHDYEHEEGRYVPKDPDHLFIYI